MHGAIPIGILMDIGRREGVMTQMELDLDCPAWYFIKPEFLCNVFDGISYRSPKGEKYGTLSHSDHPAFAHLRDHLENNGYIATERSWSNGDTVLKSFYLNNYLFMPGEQFSCATAMWCHKELIDNYNDGEPDYTQKNYRDDYNAEMYAGRAERLRNRSKDENWW
ncbi:MAG: hypothetical protein JXR12_05955 [Neptunomonas phycophila]|uniref:hypothetical protein n=1 Tax=Neptunomonas phycophila TaxID=1572645 RepID=UPI003B8AF572